MNEEQINELVEYNLEYFNEALTDEQIANSILDKAELTAKLEEKDKEIERLKAREEEISKMYLAGHKYASEMEGKYILAKYVIDELEKWLQENIKISKAHDNQLGVNVCNTFLNKLKELKEGK